MAQTLPCITEMKQMPHDCWKKGIMKLAGEWMELENIILNAIIQIQKDKLHMCFLTYSSCLVPNRHM